MTTRLAALSLTLVLAVFAVPASAMIATDSIRRVIQQHLPEIRDCYVEGLRTRPELAGRVDVRFTIGPDGAVSAADVTDSTLGAPSVEMCILARVRGFQFPPRERGESIRVNYPFLFSP